MVKKSIDGVLTVPTSGQHDKMRAIYADPRKYAAWRLKMGLALPALTLDMDDLTKSHISEVRRMMIEEKTWAIPSAEHAGVVAGFKDLRKDVAKLAAHMDVSNLRDSKGTTNWRNMTSIDAEQRLDELRTAYVDKPTTLSAEAAAPFVHRPLNDEVPF